MVLRSFVLQGESSIIISWVESIVSFNLLGALIVGSLIVYGMRSLVLFGEPAEGSIGAEGSINGESSNGIISMAFNESAWAEVDVELGKLHGML